MDIRDHELLGSATIAESPNFYIERLGKDVNWGLNSVPDMSYEIDKVSIPTISYKRHFDSNVSTDIMYHFHRSIEGMILESFQDGRWVTGGTPFENLEEAALDLYYSYDYLKDFILVVPDISWVINNMIPSWLKRIENNRWTCQTCGAIQDAALFKCWDGRSGCGAARPDTTIQEGYLCTYCGRVYRAEHNICWDGEDGCGAIKSFKRIANPQRSSLETFFEQDGMLYPYGFPTEVVVVPSAKHAYFLPRSVQGKSTIVSIQPHKYSVGASCIYPEVVRIIPLRR